MKRRLVVFTDGGARGNPGEAAAACVISSLGGNRRLLCGKYLGIMTNNQAEYAAVELGLETIRSNFEEVASVDFYLDSQLVANQLLGVYKVKEKNLKERLFRIRALEKGLGEVFYHHVSREENEEADWLVNEVLDTRKDYFRSH